MAKRRKNRTHLKGAGAAAADNAANDGNPKTFIVKHGTVGSSVTQLVRDMRKVMEPNTASRLRERKRNRLKDFLILAPSLGVTHLLAFTLTPLAPSLRVIRLSSGPTLSFRIERYSLCKDLLNASRRTKSVGLEYLSPPLLVLASFPSPGTPNTPAHLPLVMKTFQSLFPPLAPTTMSLSSARRVVLVSYNSEKGSIEIRHYIISVRASGISRRIRKILEGGTTGLTSSRAGSTAASSTRGILDLGNEKDVADYLLKTRSGDGDGYETAGSTSAASEADADELSVRLASDYTGRNNRRGEKRAVRLDEIGPRMELKLVKITEGIPGKEGGVLYHEYVKKGPAEVTALKKAAAERYKLKKARREEQERNVKRKTEGSRKSDVGAGNEDDDIGDGIGHNDELASDIEDDWGDDDEAFSEGGDEDSDPSTESEDVGMSPPPSPKRRKH